MTTVCVEPLPESYRTIPEKWRSSHPPIFPDDEPTQADRELALELWRALDGESRRWYTYNGTGCEFAGLPLSAVDLASLRDPD